MSRNHLLVLIISGLTVFGVNASSMRAGEAELFTDKKIEEARALHAQRFKLGEEAVKALEAPNATVQARCNAALAIGQLGYTQGIPSLIKNLDLRPPSDLSGEADVGMIFPCIRALADLGVASVPALISSYPKEAQKERRELILNAIIFGKAYVEAKTYTQGLIAESKDSSHRKGLEELLKLIPKDEQGRK